MKDLTLRTLSTISGISLEDLSAIITHAGMDLPDADTPLDTHYKDLLTGATRKEKISLPLQKPLQLKKTPAPIEAVAHKPQEQDTSHDTIPIEPSAPTAKFTKNTTPKKNTVKNTETIKNVTEAPPVKTPPKYTLDDDVAPIKKPIIKEKQSKPPRNISIPLILGDDGISYDDRSTSMRRTSRNHHKKNKTLSLPSEITIIQELSVTELARKMHVGVNVLQRLLTKLGHPHEASTILDMDTAALVASEMGVKAHIDTSTMEDVLNIPHDSAHNTSRPPIVTIMGHVDHGKTSLLDAIRQSAVADKETGGITQHIGAYQVSTTHGLITFIDTPGHEAFTTMRARGAQVTDIVILVVASDDGIMPQTLEALQHAQAAGVKIIVALTKIDKPNPRIDDIKNHLAQFNLTPEEWGGSTQYIGVSSKTGEGITQLLEGIGLEAEMMQLSARTTGDGRGTVLEARLDKSLGAVATVLVQEGQLHIGDFIVIGTSTGKIRGMHDAHGVACKRADTSQPVEIIGLSTAPSPGDTCAVVKNEKIARAIAEERLAHAQKAHAAKHKPLSLDEMFSQIKNQQQHQLNIILKTDVQGSLGAISDALRKLSNDELELKILGSGVGAITKSDAELASSSNAIILGFNVRPDTQAKLLLEQRGIKIYYFGIIYELITRVKEAIKGIIGPKWDQEIIGNASVREVFRSSKFGAVAGCMITDGIIKRNAKVRVIRDNIVISEGSIYSLRRFTEDVEEVRKNTECGIGIKDYTDIQPKDIIEAYILVERAYDDPKTS